MGDTVFVFIEGSDPLRELNREHGKDLYAGVYGGRFAFGVAVKNSTQPHTSVNVGNANKDADTAIG